MLRFVTALTVAACLSAPAAAQVQRAFPQNALRGALVVGVAPEIQRQRRAGPARAGSAHPRRQQHGGRAERPDRRALPRQLHGRHRRAWSRTSGSCGRKKPPSARGRRRPPRRRPGSSIPSGRSGSSRERRRSAKPRVFIKTFGCQMNVYDSARWPTCCTPPPATSRPTRRRRRPDPLQHLLGAREGAGKGVQRPRPRQAPEGARHADRRRRLRRQPGRRRDRRARALRRPRVRPADAAPPARDARAPPQRTAGRRSTSASPRSRSSTTCRRRASTARRRSSRSWKAARSTARTASSRTRAARKSRARSTTCSSRSPASPTRASAK